MARFSKTGGRASKADARRSAKTRPSVAPAAKPRKRSPVSDPIKDLKEARAQQEATADILKVIARSPSDVQPVFEAIVANAGRLIGGSTAGVYRFVDGIVHLQATMSLSPAGVDALRANFPRPIEDLFRIAQAGEVSQIPDTEDQPIERLRDVGRTLGFRSILYVPLKSYGISIGVIAVTRKATGSFAAHHVELLQTFADQAVIAIENVRLFNETQEALERQTATSEVLKAISRSTFDLPTVLQTLVESAARLCGADKASITRQKDGVFFRAETYGLSNEFMNFIRTVPVAPDRSSAGGRTLLEGIVVHIPDVQADPEYSFKEAQRLGGYRTILSVPMLREGVPIGIIALMRSEVHPFNDKQVDLATTFADQAAIAIENVRLFDEVQAKTRDLSEALVYQTGSGNILKVIASSPTDVGPVLKAIVDSACEICDANDAAVLLKDGEELRPGAHHGPIPVRLEKWPIDRSSVTGRSVIDRVAVHVHDVLSQEGAELPLGQQMSRRDGFRSILSVPMLREGECIGAIALRRVEVHPFSDKQIVLLQTFADQAVIAIENVRLFDEVQERTRELSRSLDDLRAAQDRLVQTEKLASLGQLTAGIAHEIKNPLNFVNNFSTLSVELMDELSDVLRNTNIPDNAKADLSELTNLLRGNLDKISQHGNRADSIVKNMLLHSREGSRERRLVDLNALVDESLNLAYHGARAEKKEFDITLERSFDPAAGEIELFPQDITRVLLNLISNGVYAAMKRRAEMTLDGYEPMLVAVTKNLGDSVEIRIRDNGGGISPEVKDKIFNPFFTTKPPGEGTGLGLSLSYDIVVKQHSGSIEVDTQPGEFTEFRVILPRAEPQSKLEQTCELPNSGGR